MGHFVLGCTKKVPLLTTSRGLSEATLMGLDAKNLDGGDQSFKTNGL